MVIAGTELGSPEVTNVLYLALLLAAILTFIANWKSAKASEENAAAGHRLIALQVSESEHRESMLRPNVQLYDRYIVVKPGELMSWQQPLHILVMNFGERPAMVSKGSLSLFGVEKELELRSASCLRHHETAEIIADLSSLEFKRAAGVVMDSSGEWLEASAVLSLTYSETDGSNERTEHYSFKYHNVRHNFPNSSVTFKVVRDEKSLSAGDKAH
jgi:hypothetical protein